MNNTTEASSFYTNRVATLSQEFAALKKKSSQIAWIRLGVFVATSFIVYKLWEGSALLILSITVTGIALFLYLLSLNANNKKKQANTQRLIDLNKEETEVLNWNYLHRETGEQFNIPTHAYANDLDIFGKASLYQYINRCTSDQGKTLLAKYLLQAQPTIFIMEQQAAVKELSHKPLWMQQFSAYGLSNMVTAITQQRINNWLEEKQTNFAWKGWHWLVNIYSIFTLASLGLYVTDVIGSYTFYLLAFVYFLFAFYQSRKIQNTYKLLSKVVSEVGTLYNQLNWLENEKFDNKYFHDLLQNIHPNEQTTAAAAINELKKILDRFDVRLNVFAFYFLNSFLLWDTRQMLALLAWKKNNGSYVNKWFDAIAATEVSISLATLHFNQPSFCFPEIIEEHFVFDGEHIGHPLIVESKRINNSFALAGTGKTALVTGSNMGGKSTFLRSIGINTVLALMGAPVCATRFIISNVELISSMRITDNLAESTSTFYAELKKLQTIIEAVKANRKVFILLDEILRGTNSLDRHTGSKALIKQLIKQHAVAIIATHDVELALMEKDFHKAISNYHFDVQVANDELYFDYKLKQGICQSLNASILMRKIGIEME
ncbi:MAG: hypothetical protein H7178_09755 [Chitinophagaceae bacterium]|nr:hypothetical protein [Chitinophagaceae bacterium]